MKRSFLTLAAAGVITLTSSTVVLAEPVEFTIDKNHSAVGFKIRHFFSKVDGRFDDVTGTIRYDADDISKSSVEVTIQTTSIHTGNDRRDNDLRSDHFFDVEKFPTATFKSTRVVPGEEGTFNVEGDLTIRDMTKPVVLTATILGMGDVPGRENSVRTVAGFEGTTEIDRKDFGIVWNRVLDNGSVMLGDDVEIRLAIEAAHAKESAAAAKAETK